MELIVGALSGWLIGLMAAVPIGPVNLICIRRTLQCGWRYGFTSGLGAALGDGLFASITGFGLTYVAQLIEGYSTILQIAGGILLVVVGARTFLAPPPIRIAESYGPFPESVARAKAMQNCKNGKNGGQNGNQSKTRGMASTFVLTITNPATLFGFTTWFMTLGGLASDPSFFAAAFVVVGVMLGSATWWLILTGVVGKLHARIDDHVVRVINQASGVLIGLCGLGVLGHVMEVHLFG
jgi:threonine/homoserine/homoserine lactone efflux protein